MPAAFDTACAAHLMDEDLPLSLKATASLLLSVSNWGKGRINFGDKSVPPTPLYGVDGMGYYCFTPEMRVLTSDLQWKTLREVSVGDSLLAFDENNEARKRGGRHFRHTTVLQKMQRKSKVLRVEFADGSVLFTTEDHPFLTRTHKNGNYVWRSIGARLRRGVKICPTWEPESSFDAGWLSGIFDGEGCLDTTGSGKWCRLTVAQNEGVVLDRIKALLTERGLAFEDRVSLKGSKCHVLRIQGGWRVVAKLLGSLRPARLLNKFPHLPLGAFSKGEDVEIVKVTKLRKQYDVVNLETDSHTFIVEGFAVHNCGRDTAFTQMVYEIQSKQLVQDQALAKLFKYLVLPGVETYAQIELNGIWVDFDRVQQRSTEMKAKYVELEKTAQSFIPDTFKGEPDFGNEHFLRKWFFSWEGIDKETGKDILNSWGLQVPIPSRTKTKMPTMNEKVLQALEHPAAEALAEMRNITKGQQFFESWEEWIDAGWRLHPFFNLIGTVTGRRSCDNPNLMQVPRDKIYRSCFGAPPGWLFLEVDYSQIEVRLAAWAANESEMLRIFSDPQGDIYRYTAAALMHISEEELAAGLAAGDPEAKKGRQKAKAVVLGFLYGMGATKFSTYAKDMYNVDLTDQEAVDFRNTFFLLFPGLVEWHKNCRFSAHRDLKMTNLIGRIRHLARLISIDRQEVSKAERQAINSPIQGMGGDMTLAGSVELTGIMDPAEIMIVGDIHDALLFQIREDVWKKWTRIVLETMEEVPLLRRVFDLKPPLRLKAEAKIGHYWSEPATYRGDKFVPEFALEELDGLEVAA